MTARPPRSGGFVPPPYPQDRLSAMKATADALPGGVVDASVGTPIDPMPEVAAQALIDATRAATGYPPSIGTIPYRDAAADWITRRFGVTIEPSAVIVCIGTKELVASLPHHLSLRDPSRDTILYPAVAYPTYAMGATLAGLRAVPVPVDDRWHLDLSAVSDDDAERALVLWLNDPSNPTGACAVPAEMDANVACGARARDHRRQRRVLRRVHLRRVGCGHGPGHRAHGRVRRRARGPLALEALELRGPERGLRRRRPRAGAVPGRGPQARRVHGPVAGAGGRGRGPRRRPARHRAAGPLRRSPSAAHPGARRRRVGVSRWTVDLLSVAGVRSGRRRLEDRRSIGRDRRPPGGARRPLRPGRCRPRPGRARACATTRSKR